jgi:putative glutamine amidotransferase
MPHTPPAPRIGIFAPDATVSAPAHGLYPQAPGYAPALTAAGATPVALRRLPGCSWDELVADLEGVVFAADEAAPAQRQADGERLCAWCRTLGLPLLAVGGGLHALNTAHGGALHLDLARELPTALQHQRPPAPGHRHAITIATGTRLAGCYGASEVVVPSAHRRAVRWVGRGFLVSARALDGVIEAIEPEGEDWFALGVQWLPAAATDAGVDMQLFRGLVRACEQRRGAALSALEPAAA